ncbi:MAG: DUF4381 family protein [Akkermansiaceae bacterium]|nr:DUF4381 family protein [Akkermansiaceae bacterium]
MKPAIHDITDPGGFLPEPTPLWLSWWFLLVVGIGVLVIVAILYFIFRKTSATRHRKTLLDKARERLEKLKTEAENQQPQTIAVRISLIIRQYLEAAFDDPALFETNEEFTLRPHALEKLHPDSRQPVTSHLNELSQLKYAPSVNLEHVSHLIDQAADVLAHIELNVSPEQSPTTGT